MGRRVLVSRINFINSAISFRSHSARLGPDLAVFHIRGLPEASRLSTGDLISRAGSRPCGKVADRDLAGDHPLK